MLQPSTSREPTAEGISSSTSKKTDDIPLPTNLPQTVADAIEVAVTLDIQYLWVDKYCLSQSDPQEMQSQLSAMDMNYEAAYLTIIAAVGDAFSGLPGVTTIPRAGQPRITINGQTWLSGLYEWRAVLDSTWSSRARYVALNHCHRTC